MEKSSFDCICFVVKSLFQAICVQILSEMYCISICKVREKKTDWFHNCLPVLWQKLSQK